MKRFQSFFTKLKTAPHSRSTLFLICAAVAYVVETIVFARIIGDPSSTRFLIFILTADFMLISVFYWFLGRRLRWLLPAVVWIVSVYLFANVMYFRYWKDLIPLESVFVAANYNTFIFASVPRLVAWADLVFFLAPAIVTALYFVIRPQKSPAYNLKCRLLITAGVVLLYVLSVCAGMWSIRKNLKSVSVDGVTFAEVLEYKYGFDSSQFGYWKNNGLAGFIFSQLINLPVSDPIELSDAEKDALCRFFDRRLALSPDSTVVTSNSGKNLVFIIVESLNSSEIGLKYQGRSVTPVIDSLIAAEGTVACLSVYSQIMDGGSADGQFIYNTGLHPLTNGVVALSYTDNVYPSLVRALNPVSSAEFIVEEGFVYNHYNSSKAYGYGRLYDRDSLLAARYDIDSIGGDMAVLGFAAERLKSMPRPFVAEVTTLSMHHPYNITGFDRQTWIDSIAPDDRLMADYLQCLHYTDRAIGRFISDLQADGLADSTVIVLASDHYRPDSPADSPIAFVAANAGLTRRIDRPSGQIDVFPTILDLMGVDRSRYAYRGLGRTLLADAPGGYVTDKLEVMHCDSDSLAGELMRNITLSDTLIRSAHFPPYK